MASEVKVFGIECPLCKEHIWSRHRHDFRYCGCGYCAIDGGRDYMKVSYGGSKFSEPWAVPQTVEIRIVLAEKK